MHTAEEVRARAERIRGLMGQYELRQMILSYAALLEAMEEASKDMNEYTLAAATHTIRQRAAEIEKGKR